MALHMSSLPGSTGDGLAVRLRSLGTCSAHHAGMREDLRPGGRFPDLQLPGYGGGQPWPWDRFEGG